MSAAPVNLGSRPDAAGAEARSQLSREARARLEAEGGPFLVGDWVAALFMHFQAPAQSLAPWVPFDLDLWAGQAVVSVVALTMCRPHPYAGGRVSRWLGGSVPSHHFLAVRTYVRHEGQPGVFFLDGWLPSRLVMLVGPRSFGLPYRLAQLDCRHEAERSGFGGVVQDAAGRDFRYRATLEAGEPMPSEPGSRRQFLLERYAAYTRERATRRVFRIWHEPWPAVSAEAVIESASLLEQGGRWPTGARLIGADYSPGVHDVWIGRPRCIEGEHCGRGWPGPRT